MKPAATFLIFFILTNACGPTQANQTPTNLPSVSIQTISPTSAQGSSLSSPTANEHAEEPPPTEYDLDVVFDYTGHNLEVREEINYTNSNGEPIKELQLVVEAQHLGAGFTLTGLQPISGSNIGEPEFSGGLLHIPLLSPLASGESLQLELEYFLVLPAGSGTLSWTDRQTNFIDWYPYIPPYINGQGWLIHQPALVGEHSVFERANFDVHIEVANAPASLQVAAPAPAEVHDSTFDYELHNARRFVWSASGQYEVLDAHLGETKISVYFFNEHRDAAEASLETAKQALDLYSELFGAYPYESLSVVEGQFFDGMESDALFFLDQYYFLTYSHDPRNYLTALTAHEVAHNWWFGQVGNDQALEPWIDEALCVYSELLYYENTYPHLVDWWWEFRIDRFHPQGSVDSTIYDHSGFDSYVQVVYMRGSQFLRDLRTAIGEGPFFAFLRAYATLGAGQIASREDFFSLLKEYSPVNLDPTISDYFREQ
ncbi:MAG: M1 family metallopeptidase [Chloroflexi bacterium]|nr:M1 family metallopeptidase [Chloroflexota bacterium]